MREIVLVLLLALTFAFLFLAQRSGRSAQDESRYRRFASQMAPSQSRGPHPFALWRDIAPAGSIRLERLCFPGSRAGLEFTRMYQHDLTWAEFLGLKQTGLLGGLIIGVAVILFIADFNLISLLIMVLMAGVGVLIPDIWLHGQAQDLEWERWGAIPDLLDLLAVNLRAGAATFELALRQVAEHMPGALGDELRRTVREIEAGLLLREALASLAARVRGDDIHDFAAMVASSTSLGVALAGVLADQSDDLRLRREQAADRQGQMASVLMLIPVTIFIFPSILVVMLGPALMNIVQQLGQ